MKKLLFAGMTLAILGACSSQPEEPATEETTAAEPTEAAAGVAAEPTEAAAAPAEASGGADPAQLAAGDRVEATKQTQCREIGDKADESPWDIYPGVTATVIEVRGSDVLVKTIATECLLPLADVKEVDS